METWAISILQGGGTIGLFLWVLVDNKSRIDKAMEALTASIGKKADRESTHELKADLLRQIEKIEERQIREVEGLRTEMGELRADMVAMRDHMDTLFNGQNKLLLEIVSRLPK